MIHSSSILEHDNILSYPTWYCYHEIEVLGLNPGSGTKPGHG